MKAILDIDGDGKVIKVLQTEDPSLIVGKKIARAKAGENQTFDLVKLPSNPQGYDWAVKKSVEARKKQETEVIPPLGPA